MVVHLRKRADVGVIGNGFKRAEHVRLPAVVGTDEDVEFFGEVDRDELGADAPEIADADLGEFHGGGRVAAVSAK